MNDRLFLIFTFKEDSEDVSWLVNVKYSPLHLVKCFSIEVVTDRN